MQAQQAQQMTQQQLMAARSSLLYAQQPFTALQQQQALHSQIGMSSGGSPGLHMLQSETSNVGGSATMGSGGFPDFGRSSTAEGLHGAGRGMIGSSKQDIGSSGDQGRGGSSGGHDGEGNETGLYLKASDDGN